VPRAMRSPACLAVLLALACTACYRGGLRDRGPEIDTRSCRVRILHLPPVEPFQETDHFVFSLCASENVDQRVRERDCDEEAVVVTYHASRVCPDYEVTAIRFESRRAP
jgi:hypothetical protein